MGWNLFRPSCVAQSARTCPVVEIYGARKTCTTRALAGAGGAPRASVDEAQRYEGVEWGWWFWGGAVAFRI